MRFKKICYDKNCVFPQIDKQLQITWKDDHVSNFDLNWLHERSFNADHQKQYIDTNFIKPKLWSKNDFKMKEFQAVDVMESDEGISLDNFDVEQSF